MQHARSIPDATGVHRHVDDLLLDRGGVTGVAIIQQERAPVAYRLLATIALLALAGLSMSDDIGPLAVRAMQDLQNHAIHSGGLGVALRLIHPKRIADQRQHGEHRLDEHTVLPRAAWTEFEVGGIAFRGMKGRITQDNHPPINLLNQPLKGVIRGIGSGTRPPHDQSPLVEEQTEFAPDNPAMIGEALATDLLRAPTLPDGVDEL